MVEQLKSYSSIKVLRGRARCGLICFGIKGGQQRFVGKKVLILFLKSNTDSTAAPEPASHKKEVKQLSNWSSGMHGHDILEWLN
jgi:hypothetical protein